MIINILLIYLTIMCWYFYSWFRLETSMVIRTNKNLIRHFFVVLSFFVYFFVFVRLMNLFRDSKVFDLKLVSLNNFWLIVFGLFFVYSLRRLVFFIVKIHWYKLHCFLLSEENLITHEFYNKIFYKYIYKIALRTYKYLVYINIMSFIGLVLIFIYDLIFNDFFFKYIFSYLVYYSLFKIIYICIKFLITKQQIYLDFYNFNAYYPGNIDTKEFWQNYDSKVLNEARIYKDTVILEQNHFEFRFRHLKGTERYLELKKIFDSETLEDYEKILKTRQRNALFKR